MMSGHVFHPGHAELHGITVVVETTGSRTYVGRYDREDELGVHILDVGIHDQDSDPTSRDDYVQKSIKFGIRSERRHVVVPPSEIVRIRRLIETD
jgi:nitrogenase molybdenum-iron protein alpha/beta subunit